MAHPPVVGPVLGLLTDFGLADPYVGQMKAGLAGLAPGVPVVDISHGVRPGAVAQAGFFLAASARHFPAGSVLAAVVDPGVGTNRRILGLAAGGRLFLAPDNGLLGLVLARAGQDSPFPALHDLSAWAARPGVSATFHGRDVFAPLAARLALGEPLDSLGPALDPASLAPPAWVAPRPGENGVEATVLSVDRFGNVVLNLDVGEWAGRLARGVEVAGRKVRAARTYADLSPGELGLMPGSQGFLELSLNQAPAADLLALAPGDTLSLDFAAQAQEQPTHARPVQAGNR